MSKGSRQFRPSGRRPTSLPLAVVLVIGAVLLLPGCGADGSTARKDAEPASEPEVSKPNVALLQAGDLPGWQIEPSSGSGTDCNGDPLGEADELAFRKATSNSGLNVIIQRVAAFSDEAAQEAAWESLEKPAALTCFKSEAEEAIRDFGSEPETSLAELDHKTLGSHSRVLSFATTVAAPIGAVDLKVDYIQCDARSVISVTTVFSTSLRPLSNGFPKVLAQKVETRALAMNGK